MGEEFFELGVELIEEGFAESGGVFENWIGGSGDGGGGGGCGGGFVH